MTQNRILSSSTEAKSKTKSNCCKSKSYMFPVKGPGGQNRLASSGKGSAKTAGCFVCNRCHMVYYNQTKAKICCLKKKGN